MKSAAESSSHRNFRAAAQEVTPRLVGVIADRAALEKATRLRALPDFFELRLDTLIDDLEETECVLPRLRAPLIFTARHPAEGGAYDLSLTKRTNLLRRFLGHAAFLDIELRSAAKMETLIAEARRRKVTVLLSSHHLRDTPSVAKLRAELEAAIIYRPAIFKIASRTDTSAQLDRLVSFFEENFTRLPIAAMGLGKLGGVSRRQLLSLGSALNYAAVGAANAPGQPTLRKLRRTRRAYIK
ncbi:MAG: type I 3-dehydroquinate dehydratase [Chthoniobacterales bacterium]